MTNQEKKQCKFVIGIDFGHGETSAAICPLQWDALPSQLDPAKDLEMGGNIKVIPSAITILDNGTTYIGDAAFNPEILRQADVHVCFKKAPQDIHGEKEQLMIAFMREVYKRIRENNSGILADNNHQVFIATPSGWDKPTQDLYMQMAKEAGLPVAGLTKESRAAFVRAQSDAAFGIGRNIENGTIVFDMGSLTLDFTYMNKNLPELIDFGYNCGASAVEKVIYQHEYDEEESVKVFEKKYPRLIDYLVFESRLVKEKIYTDPTLKVKKTVNFEDIVDDEELEGEGFRLVYQPGDLNKLLEENGYMKQIADAMNDFRMNHIPGLDIYCVFMTGGASRMDFLKPMICHFWGVDEDHVYRDQDPSLTISQGVAMVARMDLRTEGMEKEIYAQIDELEKSDLIFDAFIDSFCKNAIETTIEVINSCVSDFKNGTMILPINPTVLGNPIFPSVFSNSFSLNDLNSVLEMNLKKHFARLTSDVTSLGMETEVSPMQTAFLPMNVILLAMMKESSHLQPEKAYSPMDVSEILKSAILDNTSDLRKKIDDIVLLYTTQENNIQLPTLSVPNITIGDIKIKRILDDIAADLAKGSLGNLKRGSISDTILKFRSEGLLMGVLDLLDFTKPTIEHEMEKKRYSTEREIIADMITSKSDIIHEIVSSTISQSVKMNDNLKAIVRKATSDYLDTYKDSLKSARKLLD